MTDFPQPRQNPGGKPCGECHLQPGETCDVCSAVAAIPRTAWLAAMEVLRDDSKVLAEMASKATAATNAHWQRQVAAERGAIADFLQAIADRASPMPQPVRPKGFYWVQRLNPDGSDDMAGGGPEVAEWDGDFFYLPTGDYGRLSGEIRVLSDRLEPPMPQPSASSHEQSEEGGERRS